MGKEEKPFKLDRKLLIFILIALVGVGLLIYGTLASSEKNKNDTPAESRELDPDAYADRIEGEIEEICRGVSGGGSVKAVVSLAGGYRSVYASDSQSTGSGYKSNMVLVGSGSSEEAVLVCYENPEISGIGIVLSCREDPWIRQSVISLVSAAFSVSTNKIYVAFGT